MSRAGRLLVGAVGGVLLVYLVVIGALYLFQRSLVFPAPAAFADMPSGYVPVELHTQDGLTLTAAYRAPSRGRPVILFFHGNGDSWAGGAQALHLLTAGGDGALLLEYRGYGANPGQPSEQGLYADGRAALYWLARQDIPSGRIVLMGNSLGSGIATQLASEQSPAALVLVSPFSSLPDVVAGQLPWVPAHWLARDRFDNQAKLPGIKVPVLILHGLADHIIDVSLAKRLAAARAGTRLELVPGFDHDLAYADVAQQIERNWLATVLKPAPDSGGHVSQPQMQPGKQQP